MIEQEDGRRLRCPRLGHEVCFKYCRTQESDRLCSRILDCWWERFEVEAFLRENLSPGEVERLLASRPRAKMSTILDLIAQARQENPAGE